LKRSDLYFIALIPGEDLREKIRILKEEFREHYGAKHALKSPAHITLQRPFRRDEIQEERIIIALERFSKDQEEFKVSLSGFDRFEPRVIYIKVSDHIKINQLHYRLNQVLQKDLNFLEKEMNIKIHPHMTLATRDLDKKAFYRAWSDFKERSFSAVFMVRSLFLLKHNGKYWDICREFPFLSINAVKEKM
jgi:2'-5' RNA ligase